MQRSYPSPSSSPPSSLPGRQVRVRAGHRAGFKESLKASTTICRSRPSTWWAVSKKRWPKPNGCGCLTAGEAKSYGRKNNSCWRWLLPTAGPCHRGRRGGVSRRGRPVRCPAGHIPFLSALEIGEITIASGQIEYLAVSGGFAEVTGEKVTIVAESAEKGRRSTWTGQAGPGAGRKAPDAPRPRYRLGPAEAAMRRSLMRTRCRPLTIIYLTC